MKINKAVGHNLISARALKESAEILCSAFSTLFNFIVNTGKIPQMWKKGEITPIHKKEYILIKGKYFPRYLKFTRHSFTVESALDFTRFLTRMSLPTISTMVATPPY